MASPSTQRSIVFVQYSSNYGGSTISGMMVVRALLEQGWKVHVVFGFPGVFESIMQEAGCTTEVIEHQNWLRSPSMLRFPRHWRTAYRQADRFADMLRTRKPDAVYLNSMVSFAAAVGAKRVGLPVIWHLRELYADQGGELNIPQILGKSTVRRMIRKNADRFICCARSIVDNILGGSMRDASVIPNAVQASYFEALDPTEARRAFELPVDQPVIGIPGTLRPAKGHAFFFEAAGRLMERFPKLLFAITGDLEADYADTVLAQAKECGVDTACRFLGRVSDMPRFYAACDLICVPSVSESFGRTVVEAYASRRPVVATAVGGMKETIQDQVNGRLVPYGEAEVLASVLQELLEDPEASRRLAEAGHASALKLYTEATHNEKIIHEVETLLA